MEDILIGTTDRTILVFIPDPASTTGAGKTGLAAASLTVTYTRVETDNDVVHTDVTSSLNDLTALTDAHNDWGVKEVSATLSKGLYRLDLADALFASGAWYAVVQVTITSGTAAATPKAFRLVSRNDLDGVRLGLTALPNAAADAAGGLPISDAGGLDLDAKLANTNEVTAARMGALTDWIDGGRLDLILDARASQATAAAIETDTQDIQSRLPAALVSGRMDSNMQAAADGVLTAAKFAAGAFDAVWSVATRLLTAGTNIVLGKGVGVTGFTDLDAAGVRAAVGLASASLDNQLTTITADTNELQSDWANGGRLDLILDARASQTSVDDVPTNAELSSALAAADDATLAAIAALSIPTANENADALLDRSAGIETGLTPRQALRLIAAAAAGKLSGAATTSVVVRNAVADSKDRITATVDADGNRSAITVDLT